MKFDPIKSIAPFLILLYLAANGFAQTKVKQKLYSKCLKDTVHYQVWLPKNWDKAQKCPVMYTFSYGVITADYLSAQLNYFEDLHYVFPKSIIVNIAASMDRIGFIYNTGLVAERGMDFISSIKNEIIPKIEKEYNASTFRTYIGHSYAASYGSYLIRHEPSIFKAYILLAPERVGSSNAVPSFKLNKKIIDVYKSNKGLTFCYIGTGELDDQRRINFAAEFSNELKKVDSTKFSVKREIISNADHSDILIKAFLNGVAFVYKAYDPYYDLGQDSFATLQKTRERISNFYGMEIEKKQELYKPFLQMAVDQKDTAGLLKIVDFFSTDSSKSYDMFNFGLFCFKINLRDQAERFALKGIKSSINVNGKVNFGDVYPLQACYGLMADISLQRKDPVGAWEYLEKSIALGAITKSDGNVSEIDTYYQIAKVAFDNQYKVKEGLDYLKKCADLRERMQGESHWNMKYIYLLMSRGYLLRNDKVNAKLFLQKTLALDPNQKEAKEILSGLNKK